MEANLSQRVHPPSLLRRHVQAREQDQKRQAQGRCSAKYGAPGQGALVVSTDTCATHSPAVLSLSQLATGSISLSGWLVLFDGMEYRQGGAAVFSGTLVSRELFSGGSVFKSQGTGDWEIQSLSLAGGRGLRAELTGKMPASSCPSRSSRVFCRHRNHLPPCCAVSVVPAVATKY